MWNHLDWKPFETNIVAEVQKIEHVQFTHEKEEEKDREKTAGVKIKLEKNEGYMYCVCLRESKKGSVVSEHVALNMKHQSEMNDESKFVW